MGRVLQECHGDVVVTLDCDGTYPASEIPAWPTWSFPVNAIW